MSGTIFRLFGLIGLLAALGAAPAYAKEAKPLFTDDSVINFQLRAPFRELIKNAPDATDPYPATLTLLNEAGGEEHAIDLFRAR